jgi:hypothetical protein|tara:strand:+ start:5900 stop:6247 length:348 start_codon:yes stop_codon:yes gene_type:complete
MDLRPSEFWNLTYREFSLMQRGYINKLEDAQIHDWNLTRTICSFILQPHLKKGKSIKPSDIMRLPIDGKTKSELDSKKRKRAALFALKKYEKIEAKNKNKDKKAIKLEELISKKS